MPCSQQVAAGIRGRLGQGVPGPTSTGLPAPPAPSDVGFLLSAGDDSPGGREAPRLLPAPLRVLLGLSPGSSPAAKIKYSICIAGKSCKSLLSLSSCSRNIRGVISAGARPAALCSSLSWAALPFPHGSRGMLGRQMGSRTRDACSRTPMALPSPGARGCATPVPCVMGTPVPMWSQQSVPHPRRAPAPRCSAPCPRVPPTRTLCPHAGPTPRAPCRIM